MKKEDFIEKYKNKGYKVVGEFANTYGEQYVVFYKRIDGMAQLYERHHLPLYFVAGDETDWKMLEIYGLGEFVVQNSFMMSKDERQRLKTILLHHEKEGTGGNSK